MDKGNWVPLSKAAVKLLPTDKPYTKIETLFSMQVDYDNDNKVSIAGYAKLWCWSRDKVRNFMQSVGVEIIYPENTSMKQNQKGYISIIGEKKQIEKQISDRYISEKKQIRFFDRKAKRDTKNRCASEKKQITDRSIDTTKEPIEPNPKKREKKATLAPDDFVISDRLKEWAKDKGFNGDLQEEIDSCFDWHRGKGKKNVDWEAVVRNWIRKSLEYKKDCLKNQEEQIDDQFKGAI